MASTTVCIRGIIKSRTTHWHMVTDTKSSIHYIQPVMPENTISRHVLYLTHSKVNQIKL